MLQLILQHAAPADYVLFTPFLFEPLFDFGLGRAALGNVQPVSARSRRRLGSPDFNDVAVLQYMVIGDDPPVDFCADHGIADFAVDHIGKVDRGRAGRKVDNVSLRGEHIDLIPEHIDFEIVEEVCGVGLLLALQKPPDPGKLVLIALVERSAAVPEFVFPVGRNAVFRRGMHVPCADLHFKRDAFRTDYRGMHALVHVRLWGRDIVFESAGNRLEHIVDDAQHIVAVRNGVHDDPESAEIKNAADIDFLGIHLPVDTVYMLDAAIDGGIDALFFQPGSHFCLHGRHEFFQFRHLAVKRFHDFAVSVRIQILQGEVFQLPFGFLHTEAM